MPASRPPIVYYSALAAVGQPLLDPLLHLYHTPYTLQPNTTKAKFYAYLYFYVLQPNTTNTEMAEHPEIPIQGH